MDHEAANGADFSPIEMNNPVNGLSSPGIVHLTRRYLDYKPFNPKQDFLGRVKGTN